MPHQCTNCSRSFADGSKQMLGGCPDCGGNKFQFLPKGAVDEATGETSDSGAGDADSADAPGEGASTAQSKLEEYPSARAPERGSTPTLATSESKDDIIEAPAEPVEDEPEREDHAQASARRSVVSEDELPRSEQTYGAEAPEAPVEEPERPDLAQLREELNEQFESIKILRPGEYELNLMELYDRQEYIIALEEDGRYVIDVPDSWDEAE